MELGENHYGMLNYTKTLQQNKLKLKFYSQLLSFYLKLRLAVINTHIFRDF